ncbi:MAG: type IV pilin N-terminal domain-containing protein [Methanospirillum sp.]|nr:type IV pilin N-terminal domain-containing protein [Methanospirillum sp.]
MKTKDSAVSPVIAVMLMLVVTIIIAAVVSGFAGGLIGDAKKAPSVAMDVKIKNGGSFSNSFFEGKVLSISEPVSTSLLSLVTTWSKNGETKVTKVLPNHNSTNWDRWNATRNAPWGYGVGISEMNSGVPNKMPQQFGNYTISGGTILYALPAGQAGGFIIPSDPGASGYGVSTPYTYTADYDSGGDYKDGMQTILGKGWEVLRTGDVVNVKLIHLPSGSTILDKEVVVS